MGLIWGEALHPTGQGNSTRSHKHNRCHRPPTGPSRLQQARKSACASDTGTRSPILVTDDSHSGSPLVAYYTSLTGIPSLTLGLLKLAHDSLQRFGSKFGARTSKPQMASLMPGWYLRCIGVMIRDLQCIPVHDVAFTRHLDIHSNGSENTDPRLHKFA
jgi:hypothetical protein